MAGFTIPTDVKQSEGSDGSIMTMFSSIKDNASRYMKSASDLFSGIGKGAIGASAGIVTQESVDDYEKQKLHEMLNNEALLFAGLYSLKKTGDANALATSLAKRDKTMEDLTNIRANIKVVTNPNASRSSRIASSAFLQRNFGIDAAKDYQHLNQVEAQMDALKAELGKSMLAMGESKEQVFQKMLMLGSGKKVKEEFISGSDIERLTQGVSKMMETYNTLKESNDPMEKGMAMQAFESAKSIAKMIKPSTKFSMGSQSTKTEE